MDDIKTKIKLYIGKEQSLVVQQFQTLEKVVGLAFGSGEKEKQEFEEPKSKEELKRHFRRMFA